MNGFAKRWWTGFRRWRAPVRRREFDRADMGIDVGLDASVEPLELARPTVDPVGTVPVPSWESRLVRRSGL